MSLLAAGDRRWPSFLAFAQGQVESLDLDPAYPVLRHLQTGLTTEQRLWHTLLYVGYYNLASAHEAFLERPTPAILTGGVLRLPTGVERRGLRGGRIQQHIESLLALRRQFGGLEEWLSRGLGRNTPEDRWRATRQVLAEPWGNGRWATYKTAEVLQKVHGWPIAAPDMGNDHSSGPRHGLALFFPAVEGNSRDAVDVLDAQGREVQERLQEAGVIVGIEQVETLLCDFHSLSKGYYYVGHDIDSMLQQVRLHPGGAQAKADILAARRAVLPHDYLGELHDWREVDRARKAVYRDTGRVVRR